MLLAYQPYHPNKEDDKRLWTALRSDQQEALEELFRRYNKQLYNYGIKINQDHELVKDAIQQLFLNLWKHRNFLGEAKSVRAYLLSSLRRLIFEQLKRNRSRAERNKKYVDANEEIHFSMEELLIQEEITKEKIDILQKVLNDLTPRQKEAIFLRFYHGLTNPEIVEVMNINNQCVRNLLHAAIQRLRSSVDDISYQNK